MAGPHRPTADLQILRATVEAIKTRQHLPVQEPRRASANWLRPNWPFPFLITTHRDRLVKQLLDDAELRCEVRSALGATALDQIDLQSSAVCDLADRIEQADNPGTVLEAAATHRDPAIAAAAEPYLSGKRKLPEREPQPISVPAPESNDSSSSDLRQELRTARANERRLENRLRTADAAAESLSRELAKAKDEAAVAKETVTKLRAQLPTRQQRRALEEVAQLMSELERTKRALAQAGDARAKELEDARTELADTERELERVRGDFEAEQRGRRRLENALGDARERAKLLVPLVDRDASAQIKLAEKEPAGPNRTKLRKRARALQELADSLRQVYGLDDPTDTEPTAAISPAPARQPPAATSERGLRLTALGGSNHIGGSALLVEAAGTRILVDAGLRPNVHVSHPGPPRISEAVDDRLDAILVTHAHADHAGYVPWVIERQRRAKVICSPATKSLLPTVWADSARVMRADADAKSRHAHIEPPYGDAEVSQAEDALQALPYGRTRRVRDLEVTLFPAGHILGAAGAVIRFDDRRIVITGDIDDRPQASVSAAKIPPKLARDADLLVIETTYCDGVHSDRNQEGADLIKEADGILATGGRVLIPAFGLGRAQEIALLLGEHMPNVEVRVDGLARDISELYTLNGAPEVLRGRVRKVTNRIREIRGFQTGIIITTSGMLTGGAAVPWAQAVLPEPYSALFLCGHQDEEAPGKELERLAADDPGAPRDVELQDAEGRSHRIPVAVKVLRYNLSAHADRNGLLRIISEVDPKAIMLVHGEPIPQRRFAAQLASAGRVVVNNQDPWSSEAPIRDPRRPRQRHAASSRSGARRR